MAQHAELNPETARDWIERWDRQQEVYIARREERFTALVDAVEAGTGRPDPLVLDLGCGPGSLAVRLLARLPRASVIAADADPVTLTLGRAAYGTVDGLRFADVDLREPGWESGLGLPAGRPVDAVVSTTALHWLSGPQLRVLYAVLAGLLRPGGLFVDGDHLRRDKAASPALSALEHALEDREIQRQPAAGSARAAEDWEQWWRAVDADEGLADAVAQRAGRGLGASDHASADGVRLDTHVDALRGAGFAEAGPVWQYGTSRLLAAVR
jgi:SAM-dependent methyltransferase